MSWLKVFSSEDDDLLKYTAMGLAGVVVIASVIFGGGFLLTVIKPVTERRGPMCEWKGRGEVQAWVDQCTKSGSGKVFQCQWAAVPLFGCPTPGYLAARGQIESDCLMDSGIVGSSTTSEYAINVRAQCARLAFRSFPDP